MAPPRTIQGYTTRSRMSPESQNPDDRSHIKYYYLPMEKQHKWAYQARRSTTQSKEKETKEGTQQKERRTTSSMSCDIAGWRLPEAVQVLCRPKAEMPTTVRISNTYHLSPNDGKTAWEVSVPGAKQIRARFHCGLLLYYIQCYTHWRPPTTLFFTCL